MALTLKTILDRCDEVGQCWIWKHSCNGSGVPNARDGKRTVLVRRRAWELYHNRAAKKGYFIVAMCQHALCVTPECSLEMSGARYIAYRTAIGSLNNAAHHAARTRSVRSRSKLTMDRAADIRARIGAGEDRGVVAADHGISRRHANRVALGVGWQSEAFSVFNQAA